MSNTEETYTGLVTSEYSQQPKFIGMIKFFAAVPLQVQSLLLNMMTTLFDLSLPPVGNQLDIIGQWAGITRFVSIPIEGIYFSWDGTAYVGWDFGNWQPGDLPTTITVLPDDAYLTLIRAKIAANQWDGTTEGAYAIWEAIFPEFQILIQDGNNMTYELAIVGGVVDSLTLALITGGYIPLRPEGVKISRYLVSVDSGPAFAWDVETAYLQGWDEGSWLRELAPA
jgi:hypothetical protein